MELSTEINTEKKILTIHVLGKYNRLKDGNSAQNFVIETFKDHGCRKILLDLTKAYIISDKLSSFELANPNPDVSAELRKFKFAAVYDTISQDIYFFETVASNRGLTFKAFETKGQAIEWLEGK